MSFLEGVKKTIRLPTSVNALSNKKPVDVLRPIPCDSTEKDRLCNMNLPGYKEISCKTETDRYNSCIRDLRSSNNL